MRPLRTAAFLAGIIAALPAAAPGRTMHIADMARIVDLEEPAMASDGRTVALVAIRQDVDRAQYVNALVLVDTRNGATRTIVAGRDVAVPRWSPDGTHLAYLAHAPSSAHEQIFVRAGNGDTMQLTHARGDVIDFAWSPDGRGIAYVAAGVPENQAAITAHHDYFFAGDNDYTATALTPPDHLWIIASAGGSARRLTSGQWTIAPTDPGGIFSPQIAWTRDGRAITFTRVENTFSGDDERSTLWQVDVATHRLRKLTAHREFEFSPSYAPDGSRLIYSYPRGGDYNAENSLRMRAGRRDTLLAPSLDRNPGGAVWLPDSRRALTCAADATRSRAWVVDVRGGAAPLALGDMNIVCDTYSSSTFDCGVAASISRDGAIAFLATDASRARELYLLDNVRSKPRRLTHFNDWLGSIEIGRMTRLQWTGPGGFHEDGVVTFPPSFGVRLERDPALKFPVVLLIHGGPGLSSEMEFAWQQWPLAQMIASRGYVVFEPNYRGSDDLGNAYMLAIVHDTVAGPSSDIMSGLAALEKLPGVDASRVAVSGWSYGGELTSWLIGHYHDWRAAVSGAAVDSEFDEYDLSTSNVQDRFPLGTSPYTGDGERVYAENSPMTYYRNITTPTLIWGTTFDPVVPISQQYALFHALRDNRVPVRFAVFPASTHGPGDPVQTADLTRLWLDWLDEHMR